MAKKAAITAKRGMPNKVKVAAKKTTKKTAKKSVPANRVTKKPKIEPEVEAARARTRALWKRQEKEAMSAELAKHGTLVDERARVRSHIGMSWSNRKPR